MRQSSGYHIEVRFEYWQMLLRIPSLSTTALVTASYPMQLYIAVENKLYFFLTVVEDYPDLII